MKQIVQPSPCLSAGEIRAYLDDDLSEEARRRVESHMLDCHLCSEAVEAFAETGDPGELAADIRELTGRLSGNLPVSPPARGGRMLPRVAAALLLLIVAASAWQYWEHTRTERLFARHFFPARMDVPILRTATPQHAELEMAIRLYEKGSREQAIPHFEQYLAHEAVDYRALLYLGVCYLEQGQTQAGIQALQEVLGHDPRYAGTAKWYLALGYLKKQDLAIADSLLIKIIREGQDFSAEARALRKSLDREGAR